MLKTVQCCRLILVLSFGLVFSPQVMAQRVEPTWRAVIDDHHPAIRYAYDADGEYYEVAYVTYDDEAAFRFHVFTPKMGFSGVDGIIYITPTRIAFDPSPKYRKHAFQDARPEVKTSLETNGLIFKMSLPQGYSMPFSPSPSRDKTKSLPIGPHDAAQCAVVSWMALAFSDFSAAQQRFREETSSAFSYPLTPEEQAAFDSQVRQAESFEHTGNLRQAFDTYLKAFGSLRPGTSAQADQTVRERLVKLAPRLNPAPAIPEDATRHFNYALAAIEEGKNSAEPSKLNEVVNQLNKAVRIAPWWPEAYYNLGLVLEMRGRYSDADYAEAARNLKLYLLAVPDGLEAAQVQRKIYQLEYKSGVR